MKKSFNKVRSLNSANRILNNNDYYLCRDRTARWGPSQQLHTYNPGHGKLAERDFYNNPYDKLNSYDNWYLVKRERYTDNEEVILTNITNHTEVIEFANTLALLTLAFA